MACVPKLPNLEGCSSDQIDQLLQEIQTASDSARKKEQEFAEKLQNFLDEHGVTEDQALKSIKLLKEKKSTTTDDNKGTQENTESSKKARTKPKYVHPVNRRMTWNGEGKEPKWLQDYIAAGRSKEEFLINPPDKDKPPESTAETSSGATESVAEPSIPTVVDTDVNSAEDDEGDAENTLSNLTAETSLGATENVAEPSTTAVDDTDVNSPEEDDDAENTL